MSALRSADLSDLYPQLPPPASFDGDARKQVIAATKVALDRLRTAEILPATADYNTLLQEPQLLREFLTACRNQATVLADLLVTADGTPVSPVAGENIPLRCGVSLAQIRQLLIYTSARRLFLDPHEGAPPPPPPPPDKGGLFRRKSEAPPPPPRPKTENERKLGLLRDLLAFDWQVPLLKYYYFSLNALQISELGQDLLLLPTSILVEWVASFEAKTLRQIRRLIGDDFSRMLIANPYALRSLSMADRDRLPQLRAVLGERIWDFYARDHHHVDRVEQLGDEHLAALGPLLATVSTEAVEALEFLPPERLGLFLKAFQSILGRGIMVHLNDPAFSRTVLLPVAETFGKLKCSDDDFIKILDLKFEALLPRLMNRIPD